MGESNRTAERERERERERETDCTTFSSSRATQKRTMIEFLPMNNLKIRKLIVVSCFIDLGTTIVIILSLILYGCELIIIVEF